MKRTTASGAEFNQETYDRVKNEEKELLDTKEKKSKRYASKPREAQSEQKTKKSLKDSRQKN